MSKVTKKVGTIYKIIVINLTTVQNIHQAAMTSLTALRTLDSCDETQ